MDDKQFQKLIEDVSEIKLYLLGDYHQEGVKQKLEDLDRRVTDLETFKNKFSNIVLKIILASLSGGAGSYWLIQIIIPFFGGN